MASLMLIAIGSALCSNVVLSQFLGICSFLGVSKKTETAAGMGGAVVFVITIASFVAGLLYKFILVPTHFEYLKTIVFILVIAALVQIVEMFLKKFVPSLYKALGVYLPLITTNCAVLGVALNNVKYEYSILESVVNGFATVIFISQVKLCIGKSWETYILIAVGIAIIYLFPLLKKRVFFLKRVPSSLIVL